MKAIVFNSAGQLEKVTRPRPECGPGEVLLRVAACGIPETGPPAGEPSRIPGHQIAGVVAEIGLGIKRWIPGNRLALGADIHCGLCHYCRHGLFNLCDQFRRFGRDTDGGLAEYLLLGRDVVDHGIVNKIPDGLALLHAALSDSVASGLAVHADLAIERLETVVLLNCGGSGIVHFELLKELEASVILADSPALLEAIEHDFDVEATINASGAGAAQTVVELTEGLGADVVITPLGSPEALGQAVAMTRKRGRIGVLGGVPSGGKAALDVNAVHRRELRLMGSFSYHPNYHARALEKLASGAVRCDELITVYEIDDAQRATEDLRNGAALKAVARITPDLL